VDNFSVIHKLHSTGCAGRLCVQSAGMPLLPASWRTPLNYLSGWPRRAAALLCLLMALGTLATRGQAPRSLTVPTVVTSHAVPAGALLSPPDLMLAAWPVAAVPAGISRTVAAVVGRRLAGTLSRGMPVTQADLLEPAIAEALARDQAATTIELATASQLALLRPGEHVDLYPSGSQLTDIRPTTTSSPAARNAEVLSVLSPSPATPDAKAALIVATDRSSAAQLAQASAPFAATLVQPP
jgi:Flp pilus assembly protein CpaB